MGIDLECHKKLCWSLYIYNIHRPWSSCHTVSMWMHVVAALVTWAQITFGKSVTDILAAAALLTLVVVVEQCCVPAWIVNCVDIRIVQSRLVQGVNLRFTYLCIYLWEITTLLHWTDQHKLPQCQWSSCSSPRCGIELYFVSPPPFFYNLNCWY